MTGRPSSGLFNSTEQIIKLQSCKMLFANLAALLVAASSALASLPSGTVTCGDNKYSVSEISAAISAGIKDLDDNNLPGTLFFFAVVLHWFNGY